MASKNVRCGSVRIIEFATVAAHCDDRAAAIVLHNLEDGHPTYRRAD
jgi:hypothetical protein